MEKRTPNKSKLSDGWQFSLFLSLFPLLALARVGKTGAGLKHISVWQSLWVFRVEGAGDGFLECTHLHSSLSLAEQREEVGEMRGRLLSLLWAAPARGEGINWELWPHTFHKAQLLHAPCNIYVVHWEWKHFLLFLGLTVLQLQN